MLKLYPKTIASKLMLAFISLTIIPLVFLGIWIITVIQSDIEESQLSEFLLIANSKQVQIVDYFDKHKRDIAILTHEADVIIAFNGFNSAVKEAGSDSDEYRRVEQEFYPFVKRRVEMYGYQDVLIVNKQGSVIYTYADLSERGEDILSVQERDSQLAALFEKTLLTNEVVVSSYFEYLGLSDFSCFISVPFKQKGVVEGALIVQLGVDRLLEFATDYSEMGDSFEVLLASVVDDSVCFITPRRFKDRVFLQQRVAIGSDFALPMQSALQQNDGYGISVDYRKEPIVSAWNYCVEPEMGIVVKADASEVFSAVERLKIQLMGFLLAILLFSIIVVLIITKSITNPLSNIVSGVTKISQGDLKITLNKGYSGELGVLSLAFDNMSKELYKREKGHQALTNKLREREQNLSVTLNSIGDAIIAVDSNLLINRMNPVAESLTGWSFDEAEGRHIEDVFVIINAETRATQFNPVHKVMTTGLVQELANHTVLVARGGQEHHIADAAAPIRSFENEIIGVILNFRDVTESYKSRVELQKAHKISKQALNLAGAGIWRFDAKNASDRIFFSDEMFAIMGVVKSGEEAYVMVDVWKENVLTSNRETGQKAVSFVSDVEQNLGADLRISYQYTRETDGKVIWIDIYADSIFDSDGKLLELSGVAQDITAQKEREVQQELEIQQKQISQEIAKIGSWYIDCVKNPDLTFLDDNLMIIQGEQFPEGVNYHTHQMWEDKVLAANSECGEEIVKEAEARNSDHSLSKWEAEYKYIRSSDNRIIWLKNRIIAQRDIDGKPLYIHGVTQDITAQKLANKKVHESERDMRYLYESSTDGMLFIDANTKEIFDCNPALIKLINAKSDEDVIGHIAGWPSPEFQPEGENSEAFVQQQILNIKESGAIQFEFLHQTLDGEELFCDIQLTKGVFRNREAYIASLHNITERKKQEKEILETQQNLDFALNSAKMGAWHYHFSDRKLYNDKNAGELFNVQTTVQENGLDFLRELLHDEDKERVNSSLRNVVVNRHTHYRDTYRIMRSDGVVCHIMSMGQVQYSADGKPIMANGLVWDITEIKEYEAEILQSKNRLEGLIRISEYEINTIQDFLNYALNEAIVLTQSKYGFIFFYSEENKELRLNAWSKEAMGICEIPDQRSIYKLEETGLWGEVIRKRKPVLSNNYSQTIKYAKGLPEGHVPIDKFLSIPIFSGKKIVAIIGVANKRADYTVTDERELILMMDSVWKMVNLFENSKKLIEAKEEAVAANIAKSTFLSNMSHEIRTPMNAIIGFSEILTKRIQDPVSREFLNSISSSSRTLLGLINDILDFSKIEAGEFELNIAPTNLQSVVDELTNIYAHRAKQKNVLFSANFSGYASQFVMLDELRLKQVLLNFLGNAFKFTDEGEVSLTIDCFYKDQNTLDIHCVVADTGIGISEQEHATIFEAFKQQDQQDNRKYAGTGLGLSISNSLIQLMGSTIQLESEKGKGSRFSFTLSDINVAGSLEVETDKYIDVQNIRFEKSQLLIVDRSEANRQSIKEMLADKNIVIFDCETVEEGKKLALEHEPELIFIDLSSDEEGGIALMTEVKKRVGCTNSKFLAITTPITKDHEERLKSSGFVDGLEQNADESVLIRKLVQYIPFHFQNRKKEIVVDNQVNTLDVLLTDKKIIELLRKECLSVFKVYQHRSSIRNIEQVGEMLAKVGEETQNSALLDISHELFIAIDTFSIEKMDSIVATLKPLFEQIEVNQ